MSYTVISWLPLRMHVLLTLSAVGSLCSLFDPLFLSWTTFNLNVYLI